MTIETMLTCLTEDESFDAVRLRANSLDSQCSVVDGGGGQVIADYFNRDHDEPSELRYSPGFTVCQEKADATIEIAVSSLMGARVSSVGYDESGALVASEPSVELSLPPYSLVKIDHPYGSYPPDDILQVAGGILDALELRVLNPQAGEAYNGSGTDGLRSLICAQELEEADRVGTDVNTGYVAPPQVPESWQRTIVVTDQDMDAIDVDLDTGRWAGIPFDNHQIVVVDGKSFDLPITLHAPAVRLLPDGVFVYSIRSDGDSAVILDSRGDIVNVFDIGDAVEDVIVLDNFIAVGRFDEGMCSDHPWSSEPIVALTLQGDLAVLYSDIPEAANRDREEGDAFVRVDADRIAFVTWAGPVVVLDFKNRTQKLINIPIEPYGWHALTLIGERVLLHPPYASQNLVEWSPGETEFRVLGRHPGWLHGAGQGRFVVHGKRGITIITPRAVTPPTELQ